jgi:hypothetical protein
VPNKIAPYKAQTPAENWFRFLMFMDVSSGKGEFHELPAANIARRPIEVLKPAGTFYQEILNA